MQLKRSEDIDWLELSRIESPAFAYHWVRSNININRLDLCWVAGFRDVIWDDHDPFQRILDQHTYELLLRRIDTAEVFLISDMGCQPALPLLQRETSENPDDWHISSSVPTPLHFNITKMLGYAARTKGIWSPLEEEASPLISTVEETQIFTSQDQRPILESAFAHEQLTRIANNATKAEFILLIVPIFGFDIPAKVYAKLYESLREGSINNPEIEVVNGGQHRAIFNTDTRKILVRQDVISRAVHHNKRSWVLLTMLLHEYGHYIDTVLREDLTDNDQSEADTLATDATGEEGAKYAYEIAMFDAENTAETVYAEYRSEKYSGPLKVEYHEVREAILASQGGQVQQADDKSGSVETFVANDGENHEKHPTKSFGHGSIEKILKEIDAFNDNEILEQIYFGNWLLDHSQVVDPKIVRPPHVQKDLSRYLSRDALTRIVEIKAMGRFIKKPDDKATFAVTKERLGVYRAVEHIDNPTNNDPNAKNPQEIDPDFESLPSKA